MNVSDQEFGAALLDPNLAIPPGLVDHAGRQAGRRFNVYRNNVAVSLKEALEVAFPALLSVVGDEFFSAMSGIYFRAHPPTSPVLALYGQDMPAFLQSFEPAKTLGYLPDLAKLEIALRSSYHAADASPIDPAQVAVLETCDPEKTRIRLAPSLRLVRSEWPIVSIRAHALHRKALPNPPLAECALVLRPEFDPAPHAIGPAEAGFIAALIDDQPLSCALDTAGEFDFAGLLTLLLQQKAIIEIAQGE